MITFQQFLAEKMYGYNSRGANSPAKLMSKAVRPAKPATSLLPNKKKK
jgi:hypothetical protein